MSILKKFLFKTKFSDSNKIVQYLVKIIQGELMWWDWVAVFQINDVYYIFLDSCSDIALDKIHM